MIKFIKPEERYIQSYWEAFPLDSTIEFIKSSIEKGIPQLFAVDTQTDRCVGWCDALPKTETTGYLGTGLLAKYREQGIGKLLIREVIALSKAYGYRRIELDVRGSNKRAIHVYEQLGFVTTNIVKDGLLFMGNAVAEDVVQMKLDLTAE